MVNLTSLYCNKCLAVISNVHVSPGSKITTWSSFLKKWRLRSSVPSFMFSGPPDSTPVGQSAAEGKSVRSVHVLLGKSSLWTNAGKRNRKERTTWQFSCLEYKELHQPSIVYNVSHIWRDCFWSFWFILIIEWPKHSAGPVPSSYYRRNKIDQLTYKV